MSIKDDYFVQAITKDDYEMWLLKKHYAHRIPSVSYAFGLYDTMKILQGVCTFGTPASNSISTIIDGYRTLELNRLCINEGTGQNAGSFFVSRSLRFLPRPLSIISYADTAYHHHGYIYQATNWFYTGLGAADWEFEMAGVVYHRRHVYEKLKIRSKEQAVKEGYTVRPTSQKHRYFMFVGSRKEKKKMQNTLKYPILPYPKGENKRYDASYEPATQKLLF